MKIVSTEYTLTHNDIEYSANKVYTVSDKLGKELLGLTGIKEVKEEVAITSSKKNNDKEK